MSTSVRNPYKPLWQERGNRWPSAISTASLSRSSPFFNQSTVSPTPYFSQSSVINLPQKEHTVAAFYKQQDGKGKGKVYIPASCCSPGWSLSQFLQHKATRSISGIPLDGMLVHRRVTPRIKFTVPICTPGWSEAP